MKSFLLVTVALVAVPLALVAVQHLLWLNSRRRMRREWWQG